MGIYRLQLHSEYEALESHCGIDSHRFSTRTSVHEAKLLQRLRVLRSGRHSRGPCPSDTSHLRMWTMKGCAIDVCKGNMSLIQANHDSKFPIPRLRIHASTLLGFSSPFLPNLSRPSAEVEHASNRAIEPFDCRSAGAVFVVIRWWLFCASPLLQIFRVPLQNNPKVLEYFACASLDRLAAVCTSVRCSCERGLLSAKVDLDSWSQHS